MKLLQRPSPHSRRRCRIRRRTEAAAPQAVSRSRPRRTEHEARPRRTPADTRSLREIRSRLSSYGNARTYPGLADLGLPPEVAAEINRRIQLQVAEWNKYPLGYPCKPFKNATRSAKFILSQLKYNGYYAVRLTKTSPRQFQFSAARDGYDHHGVAAKTGPRQITISVTNIPLRTGTSGKFPTPFEA